MTLKWLPLLAFTAFSSFPVATHADFRDPKHGGRPLVQQPCDDATRARFVAYLEANPDEFKHIRFVDRPSDGLEQCWIQQQFQVDGRRVTLAQVSLGRAWDIDVQVTIILSLLLDGQKTHRIKDHSFANPKLMRFNESAREFNQIFNETGCTHFEDYVTSSLSFRGETPCIEYSLKAPFRGNVRQCDGELAEIVDFGVIAGVLQWTDAIQVADKLFREKNFIAGDPDNTESAGLWGNPFTTVAMIPMNGKIKYAVLTEGYREGDQPQLFTVVGEDGAVPALSVVLPGNYTCNELREWAAHGVPEKVREIKYSRPPYTLPTEVIIPELHSKDYFSYTGTLLRTGASSPSQNEISLKFEVTERGQKKPGLNSIEIIPAKLLGMAEIEGMGKFRVEGLGYQLTPESPPDFRLTLSSPTQTMELTIPFRTGPRVLGMLKSIAGSEFHGHFTGRVLSEDPKSIFIGEKN